MGLLLRATDVAGPLRWRWLLTDADSSVPLADHQVDLESARDEVARFADLSGYLRSYAAPDRQVEDGTRFVADAGAWAGAVLLGDAVGKAIVAAATAGPVTVHVVAPPPADVVLLWPLELAFAAGRPLAARGDVTFVYDITGRGGADITASRPAGQGRAAGTPLRVLAVFSQPTRTSVLALRRERYALARLIRRVAAKERAAVEFRVLQYGVTRKILGDIAGDGDGWDLLHLSGHGAGGAFLLEKPDGSMDVVSTADLVGLLSPVRGRVRLTVVSACSSAADATARTYRLLGLTEQAQAEEAAASQELAEAATEIPGLARALVRDLGCPVVGMRYPVTDDFAIAFGATLYEEILTRHVSVDVAVARAVARAAKPEAQPSDAFPAISLATPGVFGAHDPRLRIDIPRGRPVFDLEQKMAYFLDEPARFVGRAGPMAQASAALAPDSGKAGILLHGMAGAGKTACALELAYRHQDAFAALAFWQAPTKDEEWASGLADFATRLDIQLADYGFTMTSHIATEATLRAFAPRLRRLLAGAGILLVLDNLETLLTSDGTWRDPRWGILMTALTTHDGESRVILTSRTIPAGLPATVTTQPVHALSLGEAAALARELPNLRALLHADAGPLRNATPTVDTDRDRVRRVLRVVQGHPKLMELADAAAADRARLDRQLAAAERAAAGHAAEASPPSAATPAERELDAFFRDGESTLDPGQFLAALSAWTATALAVLPAEARLMAEFIACLEDTDRRSDVVAANWADLWQRLDRPDDPPEPDSLLAPLASAALVEAEPLLVAEPGESSSAESAFDAVRGGSGPMALRMHPGVAAAITAAAAPGVGEAVDAELAAYWRAVSDWARDREGGEDSALVVRAGLAAAPYLLRRGDWDTAGFLLEQATIRDHSPGVTQAALPSLRRIADANGAPDGAGVLARVMRRVDPAEAERLLRDAMDAAARAGDYRAASGIAGELLNLLRDAGRLGEALAVAGQMPEFTRLAGLGPWSQLADEGRRLQVLGLMGEHAGVVAEVERLRSVMAALPGRGGPDETVDPWNVREGILGVGRSSALATGEWVRCLELNAEVMASMRVRGAGEHEVTRFRFNDAGPLLGLGQLDEAARLLVECQGVFEDYADNAGLANVLSTRADLEASLGHWPTAADLERTALRLSYAWPEPRSIAASHYNLANYLGRLGGDRASQWAHRLAAALVFRLAGMSHYLATAQRALAAEMRADGGTDSSLPSTIAQVVAVAEQTEGVHLAALLAALQPDPAQLEEALTEILRAAAAAPPPET
jgi:tetratricopeptide (TPR) repeat protein